MDNNLIRNLNENLNEDSYVPQNNIAIGDQEVGTSESSGNPLQVGAEPEDKVSRRKKRKRELSRAAHARQRIEMDNKLVRVVQLLKILKSKGLYEQYIGAAYRKKKALKDAIKSDHESSNRK